MTGDTQGSGVQTPGCLATPGCAHLRLCGQSELARRVARAAGDVGSREACPGSALPRPRAAASEAAGLERAARTAEGVSRQSGGGRAASACGLWVGGGGRDSCLTAARARLRELQRLGAACSRSRARGLLRARRDRGLERSLPGLCAAGKRGGQSAREGEPGSKPGRDRPWGPAFRDGLRRRPRVGNNAAVGRGGGRGELDCSWLGLRTEAPLGAPLSAGPLLGLEGTTDIRMGRSRAVFVLF